MIQIRLARTTTVSVLTGGVCSTGRTSCITRSKYQGYTAGGGFISMTIWAQSPTAPVRETETEMETETKNGDRDIDRDKERRQRQRQRQRTETETETETENGDRDRDRHRHRDRDRD